MKQYTPALVTLLALTACGRAERLPERPDVASLLSLGRRVARAQPLDDARGAFLTDATVALKTGADGRTVVWAAFDTTQGESVAKDALETHAREHVAQTEVLYGVGASELAETARIITIDERYVSVSFGRTFDGYIVRDAVIELIYLRADDGSYRLREVVNGSHGQVTLANPDAAPSSWDDLDAPLVRESARRLILPKETAPGLYELVLATELAGRDPVSGTLYTVTLEDGTKSVVEAWSNQYAAAQTLRGAVYKRTYLDADKALKALPQTPVTLPTGNVTTDLDGGVDFGAATTATVKLDSARVKVFNKAARTAYAINATFADPEKRDVAPAGDDLVALNTYTSIHEINRFVRRHLTPTDSAYLSDGVSAHINVTGNCNAFYDGEISLFPAGNGCANTATINDVIYHEWGHGLDNFTGKQGGITDGAFSEGIGDINAMLYTGSPVSAPGFTQGNPAGIRLLDNTLAYPADRGEVHDEGRIIGGAFWDLRKGLVTRYGETKGAFMAAELFYKHLLTTDSYLDSYAAVDRLDDNDGNAATPSPDHCLINAAFAKHGLATAENCADDVKAPAVPVDATLIAGVYKKDEAGALVLMVASETAASMTGCLGAREACLAKGTEDVAFDAEGKVGSKTTFLAKKGLALKGMELLTLVAKDASGKAIGARTVRLVGK